MVLDAWRTEVEKRTGKCSLEEWAASRPSLETIQDIAKTLVGEYIEGEDWISTSFKANQTTSETRCEGSKIKNSVATDGAAREGRDRKW